MEDLFEGDIKLTTDWEGKNAIISRPAGSYRWSNAQIPYTISADYSMQLKIYNET
jgi:hypothetical protein